MNLPLSVVVTTFNRPAHLVRSLDGLTRQRDCPEFEVLIGDDGSGDETRDAIRTFQEHAPFPVTHVWQEDQGFRAARIRNLAVHASSGDRVVFLDGDCVPLPDFLACHAHPASPDDVLAGTRYFLDEEESSKFVSIDGFEVPAREQRRVFWQECKDTFSRVVLRKARPKVVTANLSVSRRALQTVNGLDERFVGWGYEDEDLRRRLERYGFPVRSVFTKAEVCHLWHPAVESFPGRVRDTQNVGYYRRGFYLGRCRKGLIERPVEGCAIAWNGEWEGSNGHPRRREVAVSDRVAPRWEAAEIRVLVTDAPHRHRGPKPHVVVYTGNEDVPLPEHSVRVGGPVDLGTPMGRGRVREALEPIL